MKRLSKKYKPNHVIHIQICFMTSLDYTLEVSQSKLYNFEEVCVIQKIWENLKH